eukprot:Awhi_evm1s15124
MSKAPLQMNKKYQIAMLGSGAVGKSAMTLQWTQNEFDSAYDPTIEDSFQKQLQVDGDPCHIDILDTAGQEEYKSLQSQHMLSRNAFLVVYAINSYPSFKEAHELIKQLERLKGDTDYFVVLVGNKKDLESEREVKFSEALELAKMCNVPCIEASAKTGENVHKCYIELLRICRAHRFRLHQIETGANRKIVGVFFSGFDDHSQFGVAKKKLFEIDNI